MEKCIFSGSNLMSWDFSISVTRSFFVYSHDQRIVFQFMGVNYWESKPYFEGPVSIHIGTEVQNDRLRERGLVLPPENNLFIRNGGYDFIVNCSTLCIYPLHDEIPNKLMRIRFWDELWSSNTHKQSSLEDEPSELTDEQWDLVKDLMPLQQLEDDQEPVAYRSLLNAVLWNFRTRGTWVELPEKYPDHQYVYNYYRQLMHSGILEQILEALADDLLIRGKMNLSEYKIDHPEVLKWEDSVWKKVDKQALANSWQFDTLLLLISFTTTDFLRSRDSPLLSRYPK